MRERKFYGLVNVEILFPECARLDTFFNPLPPKPTGSETRVFLVNGEARSSTVLIPTNGSRTGASRVETRNS